MKSPLDTPYTLNKACPKKPVNVNSTLTWINKHLHKKKGHFQRALSMPDLKLIQSYHISRYIDEKVRGWKKLTF